MIFSNTTPFIALGSIDERIGRNVAERMGLKVTGTLGVLLKARQQGLISSFSEAAQEMRRKGVFFHPRLVAKLAESVGEAVASSGGEVLLR